jgi:hypothetical protein
LKKGRKNPTNPATPKSNIKIVERDKIDSTSARIHDRSLSWLGTGTSIKSGGGV